MFSATVTGNACADPVIREFTNGAVCNLRFAAKSDPRDKENGTTFMTAVFYGRAAESVAHYVKKGDALVLMGRCHLRKYQDNQGNERQVLEIKCQEFEFGRGTKRETGEGEMIEEASKKSPPTRAPEPLASPPDDYDDPFLSE